MIKDLLLRNWELKLLALFLALVLWILLIPEEKTFAEKNLNVNLELVNIPPDVEIVEKPETKVSIKIRARKRIINQLSPDDFLAELDLSKASVYQQEYPLEARMIKTPPEVEIIDISPPYVHLKLEKTKRVEMEVVPSLIGRPAEGYHIVKVEVTPAKVMVSGPESKIKPRDKVITSPIDASSLTESQTIEVDLILPRPELRLLTPYPRAKVVIAVEKKENGSTTRKDRKKEAKTNDYDGFWNNF
ncbi:MAG: YbbR-like domain-containing protein [Candidatus Aminicenantes bacterium]|nr:YbbR-like domain-containing protein [Candidatus Aminicenantes bacterium]